MNARHIFINVNELILLFRKRRGGRVVECGGLENRCPLYLRTGGSNPPLSASQKALTIVRVFYFPASAKTCFCQDAGK